MLSEIAYKVVGCFFENKLNFYIKFHKSEKNSRSFFVFIQNLLIFVVLKHNRGAGDAPSRCFFCAYIYSYTATTPVPLL